MHLLLLWCNSPSVGFNVHFCVHSVYTKARLEKSYKMRSFIILHFPHSRMLVTKVIKLKRNMRWAETTACIWDIRSAYNVLIENLTTWHRWNNNNNNNDIILKHVWNVQTWINLAQRQRQNIVETLMNLSIKRKGETLLDQPCDL